MGGTDTHREEDTNSGKNNICRGRRLEVSVELKSVMRYGIPRSLPD